MPASAISAADVQVSPSVEISTRMRPLPPMWASDSRKVQYQRSRQRIRSVKALCAPASQIFATLTRVGSDGAGGRGPVPGQRVGVTGRVKAERRVRRCRHRGIIANRRRASPPGATAASLRRRPAGPARRTPPRRWRGRAPPSRAASAGERRAGRRRRPTAPARRRSPAPGRCPGRSATSHDALPEHHARTTRARGAPSARRIASSRRRSATV